MEWVPIVFIVFKSIVLFTGMFFAIKWHYDQDRKGKYNGRGTQSATEMRLFITMIIALALSLIGIVYAGCWGNAADGGRGGALGCAFTFLICIMSKPNAEAVLADCSGHAGFARGNGLAEPDPATLSEGLDQLARLKIQTEQLRAAAFIGLESARREKVYVGIAGVVSALAWKFGDIAANWLNFRQ